MATNSYSERAYEFSTALASILDGSEGVPLIHATLDDVGTCGNDGMCAVVGYVAYKPNWDTFNWAWKRTLKELGIDYLHTSDFLYKYLRVGDHSPTDDEIYRCLSPFIRTVLDRILSPKGTGFGVCVVTRCDAYSQLTDDEKRYVREPQVNSFEVAVGLSGAKVQAELCEENTMAVQMDESNNAPELYKTYQALKTENQTLKKFLGAICFADDKLHFPVQAADMLGHLALRAWRSYQKQQTWPAAFTELVFPQGKGNVVPLVCGLDFLRGLAKMRKDRADRMAMPEVSL